MARFQVTNVVPLHDEQKLGRHHEIFYVDVPTEQVDGDNSFDPTQDAVGEAVIAKLNELGWDCNGANYLAERVEDDHPITAGTPEDFTYRIGHHVRFRDPKFAEMVHRDPTATYIVVLTETVPGPARKDTGHHQWLYFAEDGVTFAERQAVSGKLVELVDAV